MALPTLDAVGRFQEVPYDSEAVWSVRKCTDDDYYIDDLLGDEPESILLHQGPLQHAGDLDLIQTDDYGYYVIDGDLKVDGILTIKIWDIYNPIAITGSLTAKAVVLHGETHLYVLGNTTIDGPFITDLHDGGWCSIGEELQTTLVLDIGRMAAKVRGETIGSAPIPQRYSIDETDDPIATIICDLRAGKPLT